MAKKGKGKIKIRIRITRETLLGYYSLLNSKVKVVPKNLVFSFLFCLISFTLLYKQNQVVNRKVLGLKIQLQVDQKKAYEWEQILAEKPDFRDGWLQLASSCAKTGNLGKAREAFLRAKAIDPNYEALSSLEKLIEE